MLLLTFFVAAFLTNQNYNDIIMISNKFENDLEGMEVLL